MLAAYAYLIYTFVNFEYYEDFSSYFKLYGLENVKYLIFCLLIIPQGRACTGSRGSLCPSDRRCIRGSDGRPCRRRGPNRPRQ